VIVTTELFVEVVELVAKIPFSKEVESSLATSFQAYTRRIDQLSLHAVILPPFCLNAIEPVREQRQMSYFDPNCWMKSSSTLPTH
jgi:hypothetical protein